NRRRGCARPLAVPDSWRLQRDDRARVVSGLARAALDRLPPRGPRSLAVRTAVRSDDRARRQRAASRPRAARLLRCCGRAHGLARPRSWGLRIALVAADRGAHPVLSLPAL